MIRELENTSSKEFVCDHCGAVSYAVGWWQAKDDGWRRSYRRVNEARHYCPKCPVPEGEESG